MSSRTFVLTDVEGSSGMWERHPDEMDAALTRLDAIISEGIGSHEGVVHKTRGEGDSSFCTFMDAAPAVAAACDIQRELVTDHRGDLDLKIRIGIHSGDALERDGDFYGSTVNRAARLRGIGHGGQTLVSSTAAELARNALPEGVELADLGEHGLRDLSRPEHVFEVRGPGLPAGFPPLLSVSAFPNNLPVQVTSFIGREKEVASLTELVPSHPLVTLAAVGGAGKTRLALHAAAELLEEFPDGVWFVRLGDIIDRGLVVQTLADTVGTYDRLSEAGMGDRAREAMEERALDMLARRKTLIVLDNCEHLIAECARITDRIVHRCKDVRVIATSREPLGVEGERVFAVPSLSSAHDGSLAAAPAMQLFVDRARLARPGFEIDTRNAAGVASIIRRLDGLPLAIELAASRVRNLSIDNLAARLDDAFRVLTGGGHAAIERHRTLEAAITWSYDLLEERERTLFRRLAVFSGGFTLEAAESVCGFETLSRDDVLDVLGSLVDQSLVVYDEEVDRYSMLFIVGQFAMRELARSGEHDEVSRRHAQFYAPIAERGGLEAFALGITATAEIELDNIRTALGRAIEDGDRRAALLIGWRLGWGWIEMGLAREGAEWLGRALALPGREPGLDEVAAAQLAMYYAVCFEYPRWREVAAGAEAAVRALDPSHQIDVLGVKTSYRATALQTLAVGCAFAGELERGREFVAEFQATEGGEAFGVAALLSSMQIAMTGGESDEVLRLRPALLAACDAIGWPLGRRWGDGFSAIALVLQARVDEAHELLAPHIEDTTEGSWTGAMLRMIMAEIERRRGDRPSARTLVRSMINNARARGMLEVASSGVMVASILLAEDGDVRRAAELQGAMEADLAARDFELTPLAEYFLGALKTAIGPAVGSAEYAAGFEVGGKLSLAEAVDVALAALGENGI